MNNLSDSIFQRLIEKELGCQYMGPDQDPRRGRVKYCGCPVIPKKAYCEEHYRIMYIGGVPKKKKVVVKKQHEWAPGEMEDLMQECYDELIAEGKIEA